MGKKAADAENPVKEESCTDKPQKDSASGKEKTTEDTPQNAFRASEKPESAEEAPAGNQTEIPYGYAPNGEEFTGMPEYGFQQLPYGHMPPPPPPYGYGFMPPQPPYGYMPQMPYGYMPPPPPPYGYMPPQPPYGYMPQMPHGAQHTEHHGEDPFGMIFGKFGDMIKENPNLSAVGKIADASGSDFIKGMLIGAGVAMLFSNDSIKDSLMSIFSKTLGGMTDDAEETE
ncbi:hypothetical protein [Geovibrio ferrireducens]|uniref:hypothetical protein n=1 Tax=Geovibrio ferrireducens TaxID=46201 RepID=UPI002246356B|nr:hypothetical protein [Geovibrio ferrireducens]